MSSWFNRLFSKEKIGSELTLGVSLTPSHAAWCLIRKGANGLQITQSHGVVQTFTSPEEALQVLMESAPLPKAPCFICLGHQYYNMLLVDAPMVPDEELSEAVKWKVKDLITQSLDNVVMDAFRLPDDAYRGRMNMLYVAVIERELIQGIVNLCEKAGVDLVEISVNELAMAAVASHMDTLSERSAAFLYLNGEGGTINLIEQGALYLTRTIEMGGGSNTFSGNLDFQQDPVDNLALDVQRSLDYYESQIGKSGVTMLYLVSDSDEQNNWCVGLKERLPIAAELFVVTENLLPNQVDLMVAPGMLAPALGAALGGWRGSV